VEGDPHDRYRRLVELSLDGTLISHDGRPVFLNPAAVSLFGASAAEQLTGKGRSTSFMQNHPLIGERLGRKNCAQRGRLA